MPDRIRGSKRWLEAALLILILLIGGVLRWGWVGVNSFSFDEARVSQLALEMARAGNFAELGMQSSTGVPNFPAAVWLFALPYALSTDPQLATAFAGLINWLGILAIWTLGRRAWGWEAGLTAAALFACAPYVVVYARNIWSQNFLAPLAVFWALAAVEGVTHPNRRLAAWFLGGHAFLAGFIVQVHIAGIALVLASIWLGVRYRLWQRWRPLAAGGLLALAAALPAVWTIWRSGTGARAELGQILSGQAAVDWAVFGHLWQLGISWRWERVWLNENWIWPSIWEPLQLVATFGLAVAAVAGILLILNAIRTTWREPAAPGHVLTNLLPAWVLCSPLFFLVSKTPAAIHYQLASVPAFFLLAASLMLLSRRTSWRTAAAAGLTLWVVVSTYLVGQALSLIDVRLVEGGMGTPLKYPQQAVETLQDGRPIVVHAWGDQIAFDGDAAVFHVLLWDYPHRLVDGRSAVVLPAGGGHLLTTFGTLPSWQVLGDLGLALDEKAVLLLPRRVNEPPYRALSLDEPPVIPDLELVNPPVRLANGARLDGWRLQPLDNGRTRLVTAWRIEALPPPGQWQQFNHLYLADQAEPFQIQDATAASGGWGVGDVLLTFVEFDLPEGVPFYFDVGMYTWPDLQRSPVEGRPAGQETLPIRLMP